MFQTARAGSYQIGASGVVIQVFNARGRFVTGGVNKVTLPSARAGTVYYVRISPPGSAAVPNYSLSINPTPIVAASRKVVKPRHLETAPGANGASRGDGQRSAALATISLGSNPWNSSLPLGRSGFPVHTGSAYRSEFLATAIRARLGTFWQTGAGGRPKRPGGLTWG